MVFEEAGDAGGAGRAPDADLTVQLAASLSEMAQAVFTAGNADETLQQVVELAVETLDGCDFAGIFLLVDGVVSTPALTDPIVGTIDSAQHAAGEGPCLEAIARGGSFYLDDVADDRQWPRFTPEAEAVGIRSAMAVRLSADGKGGALNLYARYPRAFGVVDRAKAHLLASLADLALSSAEAHDAETRRADNLKTALATREMIGRAQGVLMERERITADQAFAILVRASQRLNIKLREVAQQVVDTGDEPDTGTQPHRGRRVP